VTAFTALMIVAAAAAVCDWVAVAMSRPHLEYAAKPAVLAALLAAAAVIPVTSTDLAERRWWFVAALGCCLVGDVLLMVPGDRFVPGLASFLAGHVLFIGGFLQPPSTGAGAPFTFSTTGIVVALVAVVAVESLPGALIVQALVRKGHVGLLGPVLVYMAAIVTMVVLAANVGIVWATIGAVCFLVSDTLLALDRFVAPLPRGKLAVHVTSTWARRCWSSHSSVDGGCAD